MRFRHRCVSWCAVLAAMSCLMAVVPANAQTRETKIRTLRAKKQTTVEKREVVERKLREVKKQQRSAVAELAASEQRLAGAQARLRQARVRLAATEQRIRDARAELEAINGRLKKHTDELWARLELFYKKGNIGYVEVVFGATDFEQFVDRTRFLRTLAEHDLALKESIESDRARQEALEAELEDNWRTINSLKAECIQSTEQIEHETHHKAAVLAEVKQDRRQQEMAYREIIETQREIERVLYRLQNPPRPRRSSRSGGGSSGGGATVSLSGGFIKPCSGRYTSGFGWRTHPILHTRRFHDGIDIAAPSGTTIKAAAAGTVVHSGWMKAYGKTIMISHGSGLTTLYGHCSSLLVRNGQSVSQGQPVARVGSTGWSTGPHLHFSVYRDGVAINPHSVR